MPLVRRWEADQKRVAQIFRRKLEIVVSNSRGRYLVVEIPDTWFRIKLMNKQYPFQVIGTKVSINTGVEDYPVPEQKEKVKVEKLLLGWV